MAMSARLSLLPPEVPGVVTGVPDTALALGLGLGSVTGLVQVLELEV